MRLSGDIHQDLFYTLTHLDDLLTEKQTAAMFGCSTDTIQSFAALGVLTPTRTSGNVRYYSRAQINRKFANGGNHEKATGNGGMQDRSR